MLLSECRRPSGRAPPPVCPSAHPTAWSHSKPLAAARHAAVRWLLSIRSCPDSWLETLVGCGA
eukprot:14125519-Alexandrium_andersonii.AAC.1